MDYLKKFIMFDKFITPSIVQIVFWIIAGATLLITLFSLLGALLSGELGVFFGVLITALIIVPILIIVIRIYMELILLLFKIYEKLDNIDERLKKDY
ncbi:DUF4282 domain-containing protein [Nosocomiicoccus ampullae]|uniref:DUF4282 domain-containing protein n=1 Tax=Nosocomiicoccus ampullae TaxID=489910 RepID=UPI00254ED589|nr:DUF4282 domain-containing protein [Nosocomiicoccus ampullae]MDK6862869.1 DUF4282 domain-containing protein [Nosocomiicoccus ampullae]